VQTWPTKMSSDNSGTQSSYGNLNGDVGGIEHPANDEPSITCLASHDFSHVLTQVSTMHSQLKWLHLADKQHAMGWQVAAISGSNRPGFCQFLPKVLNSSCQCWVSARQEVWTADYLQLLFEFMQPFTQQLLWMRMYKCVTVSVL